MRCPQARLEIAGQYNPDTCVIKGPIRLRILKKNKSRIASIIGEIALIATPFITCPSIVGLNLKHLLIILYSLLEIRQISAIHMC
jgi:hypothetical protein